MVCRVGPACSRGKEWRCPWERPEEMIWAEEASVESSLKTRSEQKGDAIDKLALVRDIQKRGEIRF